MILGIMTIFTIMVIVIFHTTCYIYVKTYITVHFKYAQFIVCPFYLYKVVFLIP